LQRLRLPTIALLLLPAAAAAQQLEYGVRSQVGWTDNVYATAEDTSLEPVDDYSMRLSPWGRLSDFDGNFTWQLRYQPSYEHYLQETDRNGFDHDTGGYAAWRVGPRTTLFANGSYQAYESLVRFNENTGNPADPAVLRSRQDKITGGVGGLGVTHELTPRDSLVLSTSYTIRTYEDQNNNDLESYVLGGNWKHTLNERTKVGLSGAWIRQSFARQVGDDAITNYYNLSGLIEHQFSRSLRFELSAGPAVIDSNQELVNFVPQYGVRAFGQTNPTFAAVDANSCALLNDTLPLNEDETSPTYNPHVTRFGFADCGLNSNRALSRGELELLGYPRGAPLVPGGRTNQIAKLTEFGDPYELDSNGLLVPLEEGDFGDPDVTYFARAALYKDWERWHTELSYERANSDSGDYGASSVQDSFTTSLRWEPAQHWRVTLSGVYSLVDQANDVVIPKAQIVENEAAPPGVDSVSDLATVQRLVAEVDDNAVSYTSMGVSLSASRRLTQYSSIFGSVYWYQQRQEVDLDDSLSFLPGASSDSSRTNRWNTLTFWVGVDWQFETIQF